MHVCNYVPSLRVFWYPVARGVGCPGASTAAEGPQVSGPRLHHYNHIKFTRSPSNLSDPWGSPSIWPLPASGKKHPTSGESCGSLCNDVAAAAAAKSLQSCPTLCDPTDGSPPGSAVPGILQARTLEWVAVSFSVAKMLEHL